MPHPEEKKRRLLHNNDTATADSNFVASLDDLGVDELANIYGFLPVEKIMCSRRINKKSMEAVKMTIPPPTAFVVDSMEEYGVMEVMARALPNLQQITIGDLGHERGNWHRWSDGEDPDEEVTAQTAHWTTHDIEMISNFNKLRILNISMAYLNGRYPVLFNFPLLQKLSVYYCGYLKFDLEMLAGFPMLKELYCDYNRHLTGNINSLIVLKDTLEKVSVTNNPRVEGNFMDLADFPYLKELDLLGTAVTGDIRDIGETDFSSLEELTLPKGVYGGHCCEMQHISDGPGLIRAVYTFKKQRPALVDIVCWYGTLSENSPDWYALEDEDDIDPPPFHIQFVKAGPRIGYRWLHFFVEPCEVNWLDPEPDKDSSDYEIYVEELRKRGQVNFYRGFHQPPTEEEYRRLCEGRGIR